VLNVSKTNSGATASGERVTIIPVERGLSLPQLRADSDSTEPGLKMTTYISSVSISLEISCASSVPEFLARAYLGIRFASTSKRWITIVERLTRYWVGVR
jgi:hypothetical protein